MRILNTIAIAFFAVTLMIPPAAAQNPQQERMKSCNAEARGKKLSGKPRKDFLSDCLSAKTTAPPDAQRQKTTAPPDAQRQKMTDCNASAAAQKLSGAARRKFMSSCLSGSGQDSPQAAPTPAPTTTAAPTRPSTTTATPPATTSPSTQTSAAPTGAGQHATEMQAKLRCPLDTVVWVNLDSHIYHFKGNRNYGNTKKGAYMCEKDATGAGSRAAKNEKRP